MWDDNVSCNDGCFISISKRLIDALVLLLMCCKIWMGGSKEGSDDRRDDLIWSRIKNEEVLFVIHCMYVNVLVGSTICVWKIQENAKLHK